MEVVREGVVARMLQVFEGVLGLVPLMRGCLDPRMVGVDEGSIGADEGLVGQQNGWGGGAFDWSGRVVDRSREEVRWVGR